MAKTNSWVKRWSISSRSLPDKKYTVALREDGTYGCSCPAWKFQRKSLPDQHCKHINEIKSVDPVIVEVNGVTKYVFPKTSMNMKLSVNLSSQEWSIDVLDVNEAFIYAGAGPDWDLEERE